MKIDLKNAKIEFLELLQNPEHCVLYNTENLLLNTNLKDFADECIGGESSPIDLYANGSDEYYISKESNSLWGASILIDTNPNSKTIFNDYETISKMSLDEILELCAKCNLRLEKFDEREAYDFYLDKDLILDIYGTNWDNNHTHNYISGFFCRVYQETKLVRGLDVYFRNR